MSLLPACIALARGTRPSGLEAFFTVLLFASFVIALLPGDERFLLAKDALITSGVGLWFLASLRWADRPLAYQFAKPMVEGRLGWPGDWEGLWEREPWFRQMWRTSSILWAIGTMLDAVARVLMAYRLPADSVPGLNLAMYVATLVLLNIVTTIVYVRAGVLGRRRVSVD
ncbi:VC0807 family protein [Nocardioides sp.]|uniref:VC0807 family protein n=1 Tax=Nocardioides sp. TaxID=35761 RepID=UPI003447C100